MSRWSRILASDWLYRGLALVVLASIWQLYAAAVSNLMIPTFAATALRFAGMVADWPVWQAAWTSNQSLIVGFAVALGLGIPLGLLMGRFRGAEEFIDVYI